MLRRICGFALIVIAVGTALHTIIEPLYYASSEANPYSPMWNTINPFMGWA